MKRRAMKSHEKKNCSEKRNFSYIKLLMSICTRENSSPPAQSFFAGASLSLLLETADTSGSSFFISFYYFQHRNKTKETNFTKQRRETYLLHRLSHKCLFYFIILL